MSMLREHHRETEAKIKMVEAMARSQAALARLLEQLSDISELSRQQSHLIHDNIVSLTQYQQALCHAVTGWRWREIKQGHAGAPWLNHHYPLDVSKAQGVEEE